MSQKSDSIKSHQFTSDFAYITYRVLYRVFECFIYVTFFLTWFMGIHYAQGKIQTTAAFFVPYAWYLVTVHVVDENETKQNCSVSSP